MYTRAVRPLTHEEKQRLRRLLSQRPPFSLRSPRLWIASGGVSAVLCALTVIASRLLFWPIVGWAAFAVVMALWIGLEAARDTRAGRRVLESALAVDRADERRVATTEAVAFDELEDLGEAWAFQVEPDRILLVGPRQDLPRGFPTTDFSYVQFQGAGGIPVDFRFVLRGKPLEPLRRIPSEVQRELDLSRAPELLTGRLDQLEALLRSSA